MKPDEFKQFATAWANAHEVMAGGKVLSQGAMVMVFETLIDYPLQTVIDALRVHCRTNKFAPTPNDVVEILNGSRPKHLNADEAWTLSVKAYDESATVILTREMLEAKAIAQELWDMGDKIGARMAFKAAYGRLIDNAIGQPHWSVSIGYDALKRTDAINEGLRLGRIDKQTAQKYLPDLQDAGPIAGLLTGKIDELPVGHEHLRERFSSIKADLLAKQEAQRLAEVEARENARKQFAENKRLQAEKVASRLSNVCV